MARISEAVRRAAGSVEDFRGDYDALAAMMQASWGESTAPSYLYSAELLADCLHYPGATRSLAPAIYHGPELVAFAAGIPRCLSIAGADRRIVISTFLTVAPAHKAAGYGIVVWSELLRRAAAARFDGAVNYCVDGGPMDRMIGGCCEALDLPIEKAASFFYLTRALTGAPQTVPDRRGGASPASADDLLCAASGLQGQLGICRRWTAPEAAWQLARCGAVSVRGGSDGDPAVVSAYVIPFNDEPPTRCLVVDDVLWGSTTAAERVELVRRLLVEGAACGADGAALPLLGYADVRPFLAAGFVPAPHTLNAYLTLWSEPTATPGPGYYLDVM